MAVNHITIMKNEKRILKTMAINMLKVHTILKANEALAKSIDFNSYKVAYIDKEKLNYIAQTANNLQKLADATTEDSNQY